MGTMNADQRPTMEAFRAECVEFLETASSRREALQPDAPRSDRVDLYEEIDPVRDAMVQRAARSWRARRFDAGLGWISGPTELGGRGLPRSYDQLYEHLEAQYVTPAQKAFTIGLGA
mgnify:CR=1 FL=1